MFGNSISVKCLDAKISSLSLYGLTKFLNYNVCQSCLVIGVQINAIYGLPPGMWKPKCIPFSSIQINEV